MDKSELKNYGDDLVALAEEKKIDPAIGRENEMKKLLIYLSRRKKRNVLLLGDPGVGKTALIEGLAHTLNQNRAHKFKHILKLDMAGLMAGTKLRGELEEKFDKLLKFLITSKDCILFIDEIHTFFSANKSQALSLGNIIKPYLTSNEIVLIGCTTQEEYMKYLSKDGAFTRRFNIIDVPSTDRKQTIEILKKSKSIYEKHHGITYPDSVLEYAVDLAIKYLPHRALPDGAFDIIDEVGGVIKNRKQQKPKDVVLLEIELEYLEQEKLRIIKDHDWIEVPYVLESVERCEVLLKDSVRKMKLVTKKEKVKNEDLEKVTALQANLPLDWVSIGKASNRWNNIENNINKVLRGQESSVKAIMNSIKRKVSGLSSTNRPLACYLLAGPGGTGKTSIAYKIAKELWNDESKVVRFNMSDFMESMNSSKLTGGAPGYVGYEAGSPLVREILKHPACVILFDQIELAHSSILNLLLQILDEGFITDSMGKKARLTQAIILLTTNIGTKELNYKPVGFGSSEVKTSESVGTQIKKVLTPELLNRLDDVLYFNNLSLEILSDIVKDKINDIEFRLKEIQNIDLVYQQNFIEKLSTICEDKSKGAWKVSEVIQNEVTNPLAEYIIEHMIRDTVINIEVIDNNIRYTHET